MKTLFSLLTLLTFPLSSSAMNPYSSKAGDSYSKLPTAPKGGTLYTQLSSNPKVLNPIITGDVSSTNVMSFIFAKLFELDRETGEYFPMLAEKIDVSKDHKVITYTLRNNALWQDGSPITTDDMEFTYQKMMDPKVDAAPLRASMGPFQFEKVDRLKFKLSVENPNVNTILNFNENFIPIQKKQFAEAGDFNKAKGIINPVGSGPYLLKTFSRDQKIELERVKNWWGDSLPQNKNLHNFHSIVYRIISDSALSYEKFLKGEIDLLEMNSETFGTRVKGSDQDKFGLEPDSSKRLWAKHFKTQAPAPYIYIGWNLKRPVFYSKKTRQALAQLIDYDLISEKVYHREASRCFSPFGSMTPNTSPGQKEKAFSFNPKKAIELLKADGWTDSDQDNFLDKLIDGKKTRFEFTLRYNSESPMRAKIAQILKEQFKKSGILVNVQAMEWNAHIAEIDNRNFDAVISGWGKGNIYPDANQLWHTKSFENRGSNYVGYSNPEVDALISESLKELNVQKRFKIMQKIGSLIYDDQPYAFLVEIPGFIMGANSKIKAKKWAMKFDDAPAIWQYSSE
jgi:peptide/nickel transport system substrate-binding protein